MGLGLGQALVCGAGQRWVRVSVSVSVSVRVSARVSGRVRVRVRLQQAVPRVALVELR